MKNLILTAAVSLAVAAFPSYAHHPAEDNENMPDGKWEEINDNLERVDSPHLELTFDMGADTAGSEGMNQSGDADLDRIQGGEQASEQNQAQQASGDDNSETSYEYQYAYQAGEASQGVAVDEELNPLQTQTLFRAVVLTSSGMNEDGAVELYQGDKVKIASEITVADEDVGKTVECLVVGQYKADEDAQGRTFMLAKHGWEEWYGNFDELTGNKCQLGETYQIIAHEGELLAGDFKFFFGYQLENGDIVAAPEALSLKARFGQ